MDKYYIPDKYYVVSDLHLGNGRDGDDFAKNEKYFLEFLDMVETDRGRIILAGDIFELWQFQLNAIITRYRPIIERLYDLVDEYVVGNHDESLLTNTKLFRCEPRKRLITPCFHIIHGNEFDKWNKWGRKRGKVITKAWLYMEILMPPVDIAEHLWRSSNDEYNAELLQISNSTGVKTIIYGHTHRRGVYSKDDSTIINLGSWTNHDMNYVLITDECQLINWRS